MECRGGSLRIGGWKLDVRIWKLEEEGGYGLDGLELCMDDALGPLSTLK